MRELIDKDAFLKQERKWYCENCDRRKGVKNGRKCFVYEIGEVPCRACWLDDALTDLEDAPTIDAVPVVHGKWNPGKILSHEFVGNVCVSIDFEDWRCSICGIVVEQPNMPLYKYCPNCGAKMDGGKDEI